MVAALGDSVIVPGVRLILTLSAPNQSPSILSPNF